MNGEDSLAALLNAVLGMGVGETRVLRERHLMNATVHRYRDGWHVLIDRVSDRHPCPRALLGWSFRCEQDMADFLVGGLGERITNFSLAGERL